MYPSLIYGMVLHLHIKEFILYLLDLWNFVIRISNAAG